MFTMPLFTPDFPILIDRHVGPLSPDTDNTNAIRCRILSLRYCGKVVEEWGDDEEETVTLVTTYPKGWEYQIVRANGSHEGEEWGWVTEAELVKAGYVATANV